ncbi:hypothetical protein FA13DRAFT_1870145 [Coprinellus micaceus]|uniref:Uncharacterized protein n=1 Tax=Coprinellus micaceus TaxID=71717 RepID=A0A4Y7T3K8_COPMI|nr:hypothetical protein FA13DRAFT_1870145 [Coprinellus micaceus]
MPDASNTPIRQPGPVTIKGNIILGRPKPGPRSHTIIFSAEMVVGSSPCPQVYGLLSWYNGEGVTYPEAGYYNIEATYFFFDLENINIGFTHNDMLYYDFFREIETLTYISPMESPPPFFNRFSRMTMSAGGVATNCHRSSPWQFHLDIIGYCSDWKSSASEKPNTNIVAKFTEQGRFRRQLAKNEAPPFPYPKRFVHVRGPIIDVVFDPLLRHPNGTPRVRRWVVDVTSIHFFGACSEGSSGSVMSTVPNTLDGGSTAATPSHPRGFLNLGSSSLTPPSAMATSATFPSQPCTPTPTTSHFPTNPQWAPAYTPPAPGPSNSAHILAAPAGVGFVTHSGESTPPSHLPQLQQQAFTAAQQTHAHPSFTQPQQTHMHPSFSQPQQPAAHMQGHQVDTPPQFTYAPTPPSMQGQPAPGPTAMHVQPGTAVPAPAPIQPPHNYRPPPSGFFPPASAPNPHQTALAPGLTNQYPSPFLPFPSSGAQPSTFAQVTTATAFAAPAPAVPPVGQTQPAAPVPAAQVSTQAQPAFHSQPQMSPAIPSPATPTPQPQNRAPQPPAPRQAAPAPAPTQASHQSSDPGTTTLKRTLRSSEHGSSDVASSGKRTKRTFDSATYSLPMYSLPLQYCNDDAPFARPPEPGGVWIPARPTDISPSVSGMWAKPWGSSLPPTQTKGRISCTFISQSAWANAQSRYLLRCSNAPKPIVNSTKRLARKSQRPHPGTTSRTRRPRYSVPGLGYIGAVAAKLGAGSEKGGAGGWFGSVRTHRIFIALVNGLGKWDISRWCYKRTQP